MKYKAPKSYSILVVPEKSSRIKRLEFSRRGLIAATSALAVTCIAVLASLCTLVHYYRAYESTESVRLRAAQFERERTQLISKVNSMEVELLRTQRFAAKLGTLDENRDGVKTHLGPVERGLKSIKEAISGNKDESDALAWKPPSSSVDSSDLVAKLDLMKDSVSELEELIHSVFAKQQDGQYFWSSLPTIWPSRGFVTSRFGAGRGRRMHEGIDIAGRVGTPIIAPGDGVVTFTGYKGGYGNTLKIDHGYGLLTVYAHCSRIYVQEGDKIKRGAVIASVGNTGSSTGPHLHYEIRMDGVPINPERYFAMK